MRRIKGGAIIKTILQNLTKARVTFRNIYNMMRRKDSCIIYENGDEVDIIFPKASH